MRPLYEQLKRQHYSSNHTRAGFASGEQVFSEIGYDYSTIIKQQPAYENTCAVRMSLAQNYLPISFINPMCLARQKSLKTARLVHAQCWAEKVLFSSIKLMGMAVVISTLSSL